jgi:hypothetical protein
MRKTVEATNYPFEFDAARTYDLVSTTIASDKQVERRQISRNDIARKGDKLYAFGREVFYAASFERWMLVDEFEAIGLIYVE